VDYWDYLGWRDPWGSKTYSDRQRAYAEIWGNDSIYTPGFVLNGHEWRVWRRPKDGPEGSAVKAGILKVCSTDSTRWQVTFSPSSQRAADYEVGAALLENGLVSEVKAGENRGRRLNHDFVVAALTTSSLKKVGDKAEGEFTFELSKKKETGRRALAVWVTRQGSSEPLQATGGWLPE
jgi:hypothetical protein